MGSETSSEFGEKTTAEEVLGKKDLTGKHYVVTGGTAGIGKETVRVLFKGNATVTMACRNVKKMKLAKEEIEALHKDSKGKLHTLELDLSLLKKVRASLAVYEKDINLPIDVLINNAGQMANSEHTITDDGFELQMGINHFGHFLFTMGLLKYIKEPGRIINVSSRAHKRTVSISFEDMNFKKTKYDPWKAYGQSKLANILFTIELNKLLKKSGKKIVVNAVHPGVIPSTDLGRDNNVIKFLRSTGPVLGWVKYMFGKNIPQGAATTMVCAVTEKYGTLGGQYLADCQISDNRSDASKDEKVAKKLFAFSEEKTGVKYPFKVVENEKKKDDEKEESIIIEVEENEKKEEVEENEKKEEVDEDSK